MERVTDLVSSLEKGRGEGEGERESERGMDACRYVDVGIRMVHLFSPFPLPNEFESGIR